MNLHAIFHKVPEGYVAFIEEIPGSNTQGATLEEAKSNLKEAVQLILATNRAIAEENLRASKKQYFRESWAL